jgi:hypothetical protein
MLNIKTLLVTAPVLFAGIFGLAAEITPVDTSQGALIFELKDQKVICHIWKREGLLSGGDLSCKWNPWLSQGGMDESTAKFKFNQSKVKFSIERKKFGDTLCYTLQNGNTGAISCL